MRGQVPMRISHVSVYQIIVLVETLGKDEREIQNRDRRDKQATFRVKRTRNKRGFLTAENDKRPISITRRI